MTSSSSNGVIAVTSTSSIPGVSAPTVGAETYAGLRPVEGVRFGQVSYTVTYQNRSPGFSEEVPYVLALVELEEGVKMFTNIVECEPRDVRIGMPVEVIFVKATDQVSIPYFRPVS